MGFCEEFNEVYWKLRTGLLRGGVIPVGLTGVGVFDAGILQIRVDL